MSVQLSVATRTNMMTALANTACGLGAVTVWAVSTAYSLNTFAYANGNVYQCTQAGTSAASGSGPSGTGTGISDGTAKWSYAAPTLKVFSGAVPVNCAAADPSGPLVTITLPNPFLTESSGATAIAGTWSGTATAGGTAASYRMYDGAGNCCEQGNTSSDLVLNNNSIASGQTVTVIQYTLTAPNA